MSPVYYLGMPFWIVSRDGPWLTLRSDELQAEVRVHWTAVSVK